MTNAAATFRALADPTRRQILQELKPGELTAGEIVDRFDMSGPSISGHLAILRQAGLVAERKDGNRIHYSLQADRLASCLNDFLSQVCPTQARRRRARRRRPSG